MSPIAALISPLVLLLPMFGMGEHVQDGDSETGLTAEQAIEASAQGEWAEWLQVVAAVPGPTAEQVRIEQRVILRISPMPGTARQDLAATLAPTRQARARLVERSFADCLPVSSIAAAQAQRGSRLLLYLRDRRLIAADLEKACSAQNFYSGFYLEPNGDGRLCINRDRLQSRSGAKCSVSSLRQIVAIAE